MKGFATKASMSRDGPNRDQWEKMFSWQEVAEKF